MPLSSPRTDITRQDDGSATRLCIGGSLDVAAAEDVERAVAEVPASQDTLVLDLSGVTFMDSTGASLLLRLRRESLESGRALQLDLGTSGEVDRVLRLTGVRHLFHLTGGIAHGG